MSRTLTLNHPRIILDACCIINLYASGQLASIQGVLPKRVAICKYVHDKEAGRIYSDTKNGVAQPDEPIILLPFINGGLLEVVDLESDDEANWAVNLALHVRGGEVYTGAIAHSRNWA